MRGRFSAVRGRKSAGIHRPRKPASEGMDSVLAGEEIGQLMPGKGEEIFSSLPLKIRAASRKCSTSNHPSFPSRRHSGRKQPAICGSPLSPSRQRCPCRCRSSWCASMGRSRRSIASCGWHSCTLRFPISTSRANIHEISIAEIIELFRKVSGRRDLGGKGILQLSKNSARLPLTPGFECSTRKPALGSVCSHR